jgi:hypothetical protein
MDPQCFRDYCKAFAQAVAPRVKRAIASFWALLPQPARNRGAVEGVCAALCDGSTSLQDAILRADSEGKLLAVIGHSEVNADSCDLICDINNRADLLDRLKDSIVFNVVGVLLSPPSSIPTAVRTASRLPVVIVYKVSRRHGTVAVVAQAEGITKAAVLTAFLDDCRTYYANTTVTPETQSESR